MTRLFGLVLVLVWGSTQSLYAAVPDDLHFRVFLDDKEIGWHRYQFAPEGSGYNMTSTAEYRVKVLGITFYRYEHTSQERWADGCLQSIESRTDDNGEEFKVSSTSTENGLEIRANENRYLAPSCVRSFVYWQPALLESGDMLNSQTGEMTTVEIDKTSAEPGQQALGIVGEEVSLRLQYRAGQWVSLRGDAPGGRVLSYQLDTAK